MNNDGCTTKQTTKKRMMSNDDYPRNNWINWVDNIIHNKCMQMEWKNFARNSLKTL